MQVSPLWPAVTFALLVLTHGKTLPRAQMKASIIRICLSEDDLLWRQEVLKCLMQEVGWNLNTYGYVRVQVPPKQYNAAKNLLA